MVKEFKHHIAWTDAMRYSDGYAGLIGYQRKFGDGPARILWVYGPNFPNELEAEISAERMLSQITDINSFERIIYADGVML
jgi:hypothetical protein